jgi:hypothetical protein
LEDSVKFGAVQGTRHRGHCCFRVVAFFPWKIGWDGVFGDVLVTLWYALVMCWVIHVEMEMVDVPWST